MKNGYHKKASKKTNTNESKFNTYFINIQILVQLVLAVARFYFILIHKKHIF